MEKMSIVKISIDPSAPSPSVIAEVAERLLAGQIGVVPTETAYGVAAWMGSESAVERIYKLKGRDFQKPCAVAVWDEIALTALVPDISDAAQDLIDAFWPGPLTLVFRANPGVPEYVTRGQGTVGIRWPDHEFLPQVMGVMRSPVVLTSANHSGQKTPFTPQAVEISPVDFFIDGGPSELFKESTVVDVTQDPPQVLRKGAIEDDRLWEFGVVA